MIASVTLPAAPVIQSSQICATGDQNGSQWVKSFEVGGREREGSRVWPSLALPFSVEAEPRSRRTAGSQSFLIPRGFLGGTLHAEVWQDRERALNC
jgi:hypothetical protein